MKKKNTVKNNTLDQIIANHTVTADIVRKAAEKHKQEYEAKKIDQITNIFNQIDIIEQSAVKALREIREQEKRQKSRLIAINKFKEDFIKDGDINLLEDKFFSIGITIDID